MAGTLYLVATPIGNLEDMTLRAIRVLSEVAVVACEDTRTSKKLFAAYEIETPLVSYHKFNEKERAEQLLARLLGGEDVALITDAGMPGISDPGTILVKEARKAGIPVSALPGASAFVTALAASGQETAAFVFEGFLPRKKKERDEKLAALAKEERTVVLYEAPHRLAKTLTALSETFGGERPMTLCREISKKFEEYRTGTIASLLKETETQEARGEYVLVLAGRSLLEIQNEKDAAFRHLPITAHIERYLREGLDEKEAMRAVAKDRGISRRDVYQARLKEK